MKTLPASLLMGMLLASCNSSNVREYDDTPTTGTIRIAVDECFKPIIDSQVSTFEALYTRAHINAVYLPESEAFQQLMKDSVRLIIATREFNQEELNYFKSIQLTPRVTKIAVDAIAFIMHPGNPDSILTSSQINQIFYGEIRSWKQLDSRAEDIPINLVFDNSRSSTARYLRESILGGKPFPSNCFVVNTNEEVISYCHEHRDALGIIGVGWISDGDDPASLRFKNKIRVIGIVPESNPEGTERAYKPYQAYIGQEYYPYIRSVYILSREARSGLGSGFSSFVAGDKGQKIILKSGLLPATKPVRVVGFRDND